jgi:hypothetical protein
MINQFLLVAACGDLLLFSSRGDGFILPLFGLRQEFEKTRFQTTFV